MSTVTTPFAVTPRERRQRSVQQLIRLLLLTVTVLLLVPVVGILVVLVVEGGPGLSWSFLLDKPRKLGAAGGIWPALVGTVWLTATALAVALPLGVAAAIYLSEYARENRLTRLINLAIVNLAGVPSIVHALFGVGAFVHFLHFGESILAAGCTLAVMTLPVVIVATEESLKAIPQGLREASLALGATKLQTILKVVLPQALPGIMTGGILSISRAAGEVAPILFTGAAYYMSGYPKALTDQFMDLGYHVYILSTQSTNVDQTAPILYATVVVLLMLTFALNLVAIVIRSRMRKAMRAMH